MGKLKHGITQLEISDLQTIARGMLKIMLKAEMALVKFYRAIQICDMDGNMIDAFKHGSIL
jgi:hypothetical protein